MKQLFYNGKIITMDAVNTSEEHRKEPEAILIKDGIINMVGRLSDIEVYVDAFTERRNLNGKCLMPSFIDAHSHFVMNGQMSMLAKLSDCESFDDIISVLRKYIKDNALTKDSVVVGFGYDHNFLKENAHPDKGVLDQVSTEIPIFILHISAHLGCANSEALRLAGIDENTLNPVGGVIGRESGSGEPNGYVEEAAINLIQAAVMPKIRFDRLALMKKIQMEYIQNGVTTVQDGASTESDIRFLINMSELGYLNLDVVSYPLMSSVGIDIMNISDEKYRSYKNHFKIGGYKLVLDGSPQGRSAWMSKPYLGVENGYAGYPWMENEQVYRYIKQGISKEWQILAHCNGDAASEQFINMYEKAYAEVGNGNDLRPVMIHCQTVRNDQLDRMAQIPMIASMFVGHVWYWGDVHMKNFGADRGNHISPVRDALDRGVVVNFHQDTPVTNPSMLHSVWCAVNRISRGGIKVGQEQAIDVYDALKAVTINAAYQYFEEDTKGSISKGKRADLVILDRSPLEVDKMEIKNIKVMETIKDGETLFKG